MKNLSSFDIAFEGLSVGTHKFTFQLDEAFFNYFGDEKVSDPELVADLLMQKSDGLMNFDITIRGSVKLVCDRCLGDVSFDLNEVRSLHVKTSGGDTDADNDEVISIPEGQHLFNSAQHLYDFVVLSIPMRVVHEAESCDPEVERILDKKSNTHTTGDDPRWQKLKEVTIK